MTKKIRVAELRFLCTALLHNMFYQLYQVNPFPNKPWFLHVCSISLLKILREKEKLLVTSNFSFCQCFLPVWRTFCHLHQIQNCSLQTVTVWKSLKWVVWERVNTFYGLEVMAWATVQSEKLAITEIKGR